jgi:hypothetical protein
MKELLFNGMRDDGVLSFEPTLRESPPEEWRLTWKLENPATISWQAFHKQGATVSLWVRHKGECSWGIGESKHQHTTQNSILT